MIPPPSPPSNQQNKKKQQKSGKNKKKNKNNGQGNGQQNQNQNQNGGNGGTAPPTNSDILSSGGKYQDYGKGSPVDEDTYGRRVDDGSFQIIGGKIINLLLVLIGLIIKFI